ncbi:MAG: hypothetical protein ACK5MD_10980 [Flavobacteriales bacterium]
MKYLYKNVFVIHGLFLSVITFSQVGIGTHSPKSVLEIKSDSLGILLPRVTTTEKNAMIQSDEVHSQLVYDTTQEQFYYYDKTDGWKTLDTDVRPAEGTKNNPVFISRSSDVILTATGKTENYIDYNYTKFYNNSNFMITCNTNYILKKTTSSNTGLSIYLLFDDTEQNRVDSGNISSSKKSQNNSESVTSLIENISPKGTVINIKLRYRTAGNNGFKLTIDNAFCKIIEVENSQ